jgi:hypothetical protein
MAFALCLVNNENCCINLMGKFIKSSAYFNHFLEKNRTKNYSLLQVKSLQRVKNHIWLCTGTIHFCNPNQ